jgi:flagellar hook assembly protein FlgD
VRSSAMQRAVAIALAAGLLAASAGAFALAQVLKLERSPIEAIRVDPTPNHGRGVLDRHDSALFSPRCSAPCLAGAQVRFRVHTSGPVTAEVVGPGGAVVRNLGRLPHPHGRVTAIWNGRDMAGDVATDGSYRMKVSLSGRHIELLNPLALDTVVHVLSTNVSRRVISPDCDSHGDRVTVVVRGREQLAGLALEVRQGPRLVRTVHLKSRARALAISWPPRAGKRCTTAPDGRYTLRVVARDVPGNTRAIDVGGLLARGVAVTLPDRSIVAGKRLRVGLSADAPSLRLDLARLGGAPRVLARRTHSPAAVARIPAAAHGGIYVVSNTHAGRTYRALLAVRGAKPAHVALAVRGLSGTMSTFELRAYQRKLDALGIRFDVLTQRDIARGALDGYKVVVAPPSGAAVVELAHGQVIRSLAGITPGLGS